PDVAIDAPGHPKEKNTASKREADDREELTHAAGEDDADRDGCYQPPEDHLSPLCPGHACGRHADYDRVVASESNVDQDDLDERDESVIREVKQGAPFSATPSGLPAAATSRWHQHYRPS